MNADFRPDVTPDWVSLLLLTSLLLLALSRYYFPARFISFLSLPFNGKFMAIIQSDNPLTGFHVLISLFMLINSSLFLYLLCHQGSIGWMNWGSEAPYIKFFLGVGGWLSLKILLQWLQGYIFDQNPLTSTLIYSKSAYFNYSGLLFFTGNVVLTYVSPESAVVIVAVVLLALLINALGALTLVNQHIQRIYAHFMYFILYICALEIAPLILIGGYLNI